MYMMRYILSVNVHDSIHLRNMPTNQPTVNVEKWLNLILLDWGMSREGSLKPQIDQIEYWD